MWKRYTWKKVIKNKTGKGKKYFIGPLMQYVVVVWILRCAHKKNPKGPQINVGAIDVKMDGSVLEDKSPFKMLGLTF